MAVCPLFWQPSASVLGIDPAASLPDRLGYSLIPRFIFALAVVTKAYHNIRRDPRWLRHIELQLFELNRPIWVEAVSASMRRYSGLDFSKVLAPELIVA